MRRKLNLHIVGLKGVPATFGGVERSVEEVGARLAARGHRVVVHCRTHYTEAGLSEYRGMILHREPSLRLKRTDTLSHTVLGLVASLRDRPDVIALHNYPNGILAAIARPFRVPVVLHLHGFEWGLDKWNAADKTVLRALLRPGVAAPTAITSVSRSQAEFVHQATGREVAHIPNGVSYPEKLEASATWRPGLEEEGLPPLSYILCVSRLVPQKGVEHLIRAYAGFESPLPLVIVGDHNHAPEYASHLKELARPDPRVRFLGYRFGEDLWRLYAGCFLFVFPSETEGMPLVLLEAMAARRPILASKLAEVEDVGQGTIAYFESRNAADLLLQLRSLAGDEARRRVLGQAAGQRAREHYDWGSLAEAYEQLYLKAAGMDGRERVSRAASG